MENEEVPQMTLRFLAWATGWVRCHSLRYPIHSMWRELTWFGARIRSFNLYLLILRCFETFKKLHQLNIYMWLYWYSVTKSCLTLCDPTDYSLPSSSDHGISQTRILEWFAISFSRGSSWPKDWTHIFLLAGRVFTNEPSGKPLNINMHECKKKDLSGICKFLHHHGCRRWTMMYA